MRNDKELIKVAIDNFQIFERFQCDGLCQYVIFLTDGQATTKDEQTRLLELIKEHKPKETINLSYHYKKFEAAPRLELLKEILEKV